MEDSEFLFSFPPHDALSRHEPVPARPRIPNPLDSVVVAQYNHAMAQRERRDRTYINNLWAQRAEIPVSQSCSLHISNLPPDCTISQLLGSIRGVGKIYASNTRPPTDKYHTAAAKIVFWDRASVDRLLTRSFQGAFIIGRYTPHVRMNDHRVAAQPQSEQSRVLQIDGPIREIFRPAAVLPTNEILVVIKRLHIRFYQAIASRHSKSRDVQGGTNRRHHNITLR